MDQMSSIGAAVKRGALHRFRFDDLEEGELEQRMVWMRPDVRTVIANLTSEQKATVLAALRRFIVGGHFTVITAQCEQPKEVKDVGDIRELKGSGPPFVELRFKPPPAHLRLFGRFIGRDLLFLTTSGVKAPNEKTTKRLDIRQERKRCEDIFRACNFPENWVPTRIQDSLSNATFV